MICSMQSHGILISEARELFPTKSGRLVHINTIRRWIGKGVKVNGRPVRLRAERVGVRLTTRPEWVEQFITDCGSDGTEPASFGVRSPAPSGSAAERFLREEGMYGRVEKRKVSDQKVSAHSRGVRALSPVLPAGDASRG
jgi:hypothetical protein